MLSKFKKIPLYRSYLGLIISDSKEDVRKIVSDFEDEEVYAHMCNHDYKGHNCFSIVLNFNHKYTKITHGVIAHEALHVIEYVCQYIGMKYDFENPESITYLMT